MIVCRPTPHTEVSNVSLVPKFSSPGFFRSHNFIIKSNGNEDKLAAPPLLGERLVDFVLNPSAYSGIRPPNGSVLRKLARNTLKRGSSKMAYQDERACCAVVRVAMRQDCEAQLLSRFMIYHSLTIGMNDIY
jgi:hypothetical protein